MKIKIKAFANVREICGFDEKVLSLPESAKVKDVLKELAANNPMLLEIMGSLLFAINEEYSSKESKLNSNDTLAIFPPVSGG